jgi:MFS family permease
MEGTSTRRKLAIFGGLMLPVLLAASDQTIVATALPTIAADLGGLDRYSWVVSAYMLASTATLPIYGKLSDIYGRRPVFIFGTMVFLVGSVLAGLSQDMGQLIAFRGVQPRGKRHAAAGDGDHRGHRSSGGQG